MTAVCGVDMEIRNLSLKDAIQCIYFQGKNFGNP